MQQKTRARDSNSAGPLADAGPYTYDLPVVSGNAPPEHAPRPARQDWGLSWKAVAAIITATVADQALGDWGGLSRLHWQTILICALAVSAYWEIPKPRPGFVRWTTKVVGIFLNFFVACVTVPQSLRGLIPDPLAFGLPAFVTMLVFYWVPPLIQTNHRPLPLWKWLLSAAGFAAIWAWVGPIFVK